jgi:hypothetical protein
MKKILAILSSLTVMFSGLTTTAYAKTNNSDEVCDINGYEDTAKPYEGYISDDESIENIPDSAIRTGESTVLPEGKKLSAGESYNQGDCKAVMQYDGNFVVYNSSGKALFNTRTFGKNNYAVMQGDGNFVIYNSSGKAIWSTNTNIYGKSHDYALILSETGELYVKDKTSGYHIWSSKNGAAKRSLTKGVCISSKNRKYFAIMQNDGNFVVYKLEKGSKTAVWSTHTGGNKSAYLKMQADGNMVVYNASSKALFSTKTNFGSKYNYALTLTDNGNLQLTKNNSIIWSS